MTSDCKSLPESTDGFPRPAILIVDDRKANLVALRRVMKDLDAEIVEADCGNAALTATLDHDFALAILDVQMPGMDGYELAALLRGDPRTRTMPIVFMTAAYGDETHLFKAYEAGAVDYIVKPYNPTVLLSKISVFLELKRKAVEVSLKAAELAASEARLRASSLAALNLMNDAIEARQMAEQVGAELRASNEELRRFNRAMVDRELRMIELKREVNDLRAKAGLPAAYEVRDEGL